jgi:hypothetical protein
MHLTISARFCSLKSASVSAVQARAQSLIASMAAVSADLALINGIGWAALAHSGGAGENADGSGVPTWGESTPTISPRKGARWPKG